MICIRCGMEIPEVAYFCPYCRGVVDKKTLERNQRNLNMAGAVCLAAIIIMALVCVLSSAH